MKKKILAVLGQTCSGKDTLIDRVCLTAPTGLVHRVQRVTTRKPRLEEQESANYQFVSGAAFDSMVRSGQIVESSSYRGWKYGTMESSLYSSAVNIMSLDLKSFKKLVRERSYEYDIRCILLDASFKQRLKRYRDREHGTPGLEMYRRLVSDSIMYRHPINDLLKLEVAYAYMPDEYGLYRKTTSVINFCHDWFRGQKF